MNKLWLKISLFIVLSTLLQDSFSQAILVNNEGRMKIHSGAHMHVEGSVINKASSELVIDENTAANSVLFVTGNITNDGTLELNETSSIKISGNWNNNSAFNSGIGTVELVGSTQQTVKSNGSSFYELNFNNTQGGSSAILLSDDLKITNSVTFTNGILNTGVYKVIFETGASSSESSQTSFINGAVSKTGNTAFKFPIGDGNAWGPCAIAAPAGTSTIDAQYKHSAGPANWNTGYMCPESGLNHTSGVEHWLLSSTNSHPAVTLFWNTESDVADLLDLTVAHWNGSCWENKGGTATGNTSSGSITSSVPFTSYNPITLGTLTKDNSLPIDLATFEADCKADAKHIRWTTLTEVNNHYFTLEKSFNGVDFEPIAQIQGEGNSNQIKHYNYQDNDQSNEVVYYRLSQTDFDGTTKKYPIIAVDCSQEQEISIMPNPFKSVIQIRGLLNNCMVDIYGARGEKILSIQNHDSNVLKVNLGHLSNGIYFVRILDANGTFKNFKIIKN